MRSVAEFVQQGITTPGDLQEALQLAMQLEFATIPPYLCAEWSIDLSSDADKVASLISSIAVQEMFHFALAGNMLTAIGGTPDIANASFIPTYPTHVLPGNIFQKLAVDLKPLSPDQLAVFMQIEEPEFKPVGLALAEGPKTIGAFYDTISEGFNTVSPAIVPNALAVNLGEAVPITSIADAQAAIARIKGEGEGTEGDPDQPPADGTVLAHYYVFKEIKEGKTFVQGADGKWHFDGPAIQFPTKIYNFSESNPSPDPSIPFNQTLTNLLIELQTCWTAAGNTPSFGLMNTLSTQGQGLIQAGARPEFFWAPS
jgi:hypothetical protein